MSVEVLHEIDNADSNSFDQSLSTFLCFLRKLVRWALRPGGKIQLEIVVICAVNIRKTKSSWSDKTSSTSSCLISKSKLQWQSKMCCFRPPATVYCHRCLSRQVVDLFNDSDKRRFPPKMVLSFFDWSIPLVGGWGIGWTLPFYDCHISFIHSPLTLTLVVDKYQPHTV